MIYFAQAVDGGPIKIGCSVDVKTRVAQLGARYGKRLSILATMPGGRCRERQIHSKFAHLRLGRPEQFRPGADLLRFIGRPVFVNASPIELMESTWTPRCILAPGIGGTVAMRDWLDEMSRDTKLPRASIIRDALAMWAKAKKLAPPPEE